MSNSFHNCAVPPSSRGSDLWAASVLAAAMTLAVLLVSSPESEAAYAAHLLKDINLKGNQDNYPIHRPTDLNGTAFFAAWDVDHGSELWKSDGTPAGTVLVKDIVPGRAGAGPKPDWITAVGDSVFFNVTAASGLGPDLWKSDGTELGTVCINTSHDPPALLIMATEVVDGIMYFGGVDDAHGAEFWRSDGTDAGTYMIRDINPGPDDSLPSRCTQFGGKIYFQAQDGTGGGQLWVSDGTHSGTQMLRKFGSGNYVYVESLTVFNDALYFCTDDGVHGEELWRTDGTYDGTWMVTDIRPGGYSSHPQSFRVANGLLFFRADDGVNGVQLWQTDGTEPGTIRLTSLSYTYIYSPIGDLTVVGNRVFFSAGPETALDSIWSSDGTVAGTALVKSISEPRDLACINGLLMFSTGSGLWRCDGTESGTYLVSSVHPFWDGTGPNLTAVGSRGFFVARDADLGLPLWTTDGTATGTKMLKDIDTSTKGSNAQNYQVIDNQVFFTADDGTSDQLWKTDAMPGGTVRVCPECASSAFPVSFGGALYLADGAKLMKVAAGASSAVCIKNFWPGRGITGVVASRAGLIIAADDGSHGEELWKSDGTPAGTVLLKDIWPGSDPSDPASLTPFDDLVLFVADDSVHGQAVWKTDGTTDGTMLVKDVGAGQYGWVWGFGPVYQGSVCFGVLSDTTSGLWRTDATPAGTAMIKLTGSYSIISRPVILDNLLYFNYGGLWKSDGTTTGTTLIYPIDMNDEVVAFSDQLFFAADDDTHGSELWRSDGNTDGSHMVSDLRPGALGSFPASFCIFQGRLWFKADADASRAELWSTDGTQAGTILVADIDLFGSSRPQAPFATADTLYFQADDGIHGAEPWVFSNQTILVYDLPVGGWKESGEPLTWTITAEDYSGVLSYQWFKNGEAIQDSTDEVFSIESLSVDDTGSYSCQITNGTGDLYSTPLAMVTVFPPGSLPASARLGLALAATCILALATSRFLREM